MCRKSTLVFLLLMKMPSLSKADSDRFSLVLKFNAFEKQKYHGLRMIDLNSNIMDATAMKDAVSYDMCRYIGLPAPLCNYAKITVNGEYYGCFLAVEPVGKDFCNENPSLSSVSSTARFRQAVTVRQMSPKQ